MDEMEFLEVLADLKNLMSEMERGVVTVIACPPLDASQTNSYKWTLKKAVFSIRQDVAKRLSCRHGVEVRGTKLLTSILLDMKRIYEGESSYGYYDHPFDKEDGLSSEMSQCIDVAWSMVKETKTTIRELETLRNATAMTKSDKTSRETTQEKKMGRFVDKTKDESETLHDILFSCHFKETDEIKNNLEDKCDGNAHLYSLFLAGNTVKRCSGELEKVKALLLKACHKCDLDEENYKDWSVLAVAEAINDYVSEVTNKYRDTESQLRESKIQVDQLTQENKSVNSRSTVREAEVEEKINCLTKERDDLVAKRSVTEHKVEESRTEIDRLKEEKANLITKLKDTESDLTTKVKEICMLQKEKGDLLNRLSQYTSAQLTHDNPNVADLSDPYRPTKLAEQFSELYDNQWTDAFGVLTENFRLSEEKTVRSLLFLLIQAYEFCMNSFTAQDRYIQLALQGKSSSSIVVHEETDSAELDLTTLDLKMIHNLKKRTRDSSTKAVEENFVKEVKKWAWIDVDHKDLKEYAIQCVHICWHMMLQSPKLYIDCNCTVEGTFSTNKYKHYKTQGQRYKFIVWPVLYTHKEGPILSKGVAEAE